MSRQNGGEEFGSGGYLVSAEAAAGVLCDYFLNNAERGDNVANDDLVAELTRRIRARRTSSIGVSIPRTAETTFLSYQGDQ